MTPMSAPESALGKGESVATIYDVARSAGVSPKTFSRVLNSDAPVGKETRARVEDAIRSLGYVPSNAARMMRSNKSGLIGLITGAISGSPEPSEPTGLPDLYIIQGIQRAMADLGKTLMIADTGGKSERVPELIRTFLEHRVEGLIYVADYHRKVSFGALPASCPLILVNCHDDQGAPSILPDDRTCQRNLVEHLIRAGHSRIGFLTLAPGMDASRLRHEGYRDGLESHGLSYDAALVEVGYERVTEQDYRQLEIGLEALLSLDHPPSVICCGNDEMALRLYGLLRTRGVRVPQDISVAGFDNYRTIAETLYPPLTTVELPYPEMGRLAATSLLDMIGDAASRNQNTVHVPGPVVWRSSVTARTSLS